MLKCKLLIILEHKLCQTINYVKLIFTAWSMLKQHSCLSVIYDRQNLALQVPIKLIWEKHFET